MASEASFKQFNDRMLEFTEREGDDVEIGSVQRVQEQTTNRDGGSTTAHTSLNEQRRGKLNTSNGSKVPMVTDNKSMQSTNMQSVVNSMTAEQYNRYYAAAQKSQETTLQQEHILPRSSSSSGLRPQAKKKIEKYAKERPLLQSGGMSREPP